MTTNSAGNISLSTAPMTINGQPLGGGFSFSYDLGGSTSEIASQAYNFLAANNTQDQGFLGQTILGTQSFLQNQSTPLLNAAIGLQQMNANQQAYQQTTAVNAAGYAAQQIDVAQQTYQGTINNLANYSQQLTSQAIMQVGANTASSNQASVQASSNSGGGFCFITTAICEASGKPDNCEELTILRKFRDEYMLIDSERKKLVEEYYKIAPGIVSKLKTLDDSEFVFKEILDRFITPCIMYIERGCNKCAMNHYIRMIETCKQLIEDI